MAPAANTVSVGGEGAAVIAAGLNFQVPDRLIRGQNHPAGFPVRESSAYSRLGAFSVNRDASSVPV